MNSTSTSTSLISQFPYFLLQTQSLISGAIISTLERLRVQYSLLLLLESGSEKIKSVLGFSGVPGWDFTIYLYTGLLFGFYICCAYSLGVCIEYQQRPTGSDEEEPKAMERNCNVCLEFLRYMEEEPEKATAECDHITETCLACLKKSMQVLLDEGNHVLKCPTCGEDLEQWFINLFCSPSMWKR